MEIRDILNKIIWDEKETAHENTITYRHNGVPKDQKSFTCEQILFIYSNALVYVSPSEGTVTVPLHRILTIKHNRKSLYKKKKLKHKA